MEFTTIRLAHKKSAVEIESLKKYDIYSDIATILKDNNVFKVYKGTKFYDIIGLVDPWNIAISERFKKLLEENNIKGLECYPIIIQGTNSKYYVLNIVGRSGLICEFDDEGDVKYGSINVDYNTWDGSDIFLLGQGGIKVINNKLKMIIEQAKITNLEFEEINKY